MSYILGVMMVLVAGTLLVSGWLAGSDRLPRNDQVGVRTQRTLEDPVAWQVAHREAGPWIIAAGMADLLAALALLSGLPGEVAGAVFVVGALFTLVLLIVANGVGAGAVSRRLSR